MKVIKFLRCLFGHEKTRLTKIHAYYAHRWVPETTVEYREKRLAETYHCGRCNKKHIVSKRLGSS